MKINLIENTDFKSLHFSKVNKPDMRFVTDELVELAKMGRNYDIWLKSGLSDNGGFGPRYKVIEVLVKPLKENLSFFKKIFRPKAKSLFYTDFAPYPEADGEYLCDMVKKAIEQLKRN